MSYRGIRKKLSKSIAILAASPMVVNAIGSGGVVVKASVGSRVLPRVAGASSSIASSRINTPRLNTTNLNTGGVSGSRLPSTSLPTSSVRYTPSKGEKVLAGISLGVAGVSIIGTAVGLGLTQDQYDQTKKTYEDVVERTYNSFYDEREKYMSDLFAKWGVPLPDKYKNPMKETEQSKPTPGFNIGTGE